MKALSRNTACRICSGSRLNKILSFGSTPLANSFLKKEELQNQELRFPLEVYLCSDCSLVQMLDIVSPEIMFRNYVYVSSTSPSFVAHFRAFASHVVERFSLPEHSLVIDVGSNDGILLRPFKEQQMRVLGIDPAENLAQLATESGIETLPRFFHTEVAREVVSRYGKASVITANNVFAHVNNLHEFAEAVKILLNDTGAFIFEVPYLGDLYRQNLFDTVYHEHLSYFAVQPLVYFFSRHGMRIFNIEKVSSHGGSLRVFVKPGSETRDGIVGDYLEEERKLKLDSLHTWAEFSNKIILNKQKLQQMVRDLKSEGKRIAGYGAPAKGNTLLNYFEIGNRILDYIVDDSAFKQGLFTPGTHIPVVAPERLKVERPDHLLILAWNFAEQIMNKLGDYQSAGGKFIIPVPEARII
jgi:C-methyltransferase C-terminal domain/Putative zinc binding domain/Methyltransferase domain